MALCNHWKEKKIMASRRDKMIWFLNRWRSPNPVIEWTSNEQTIKHATKPFLSHLGQTKPSLTKPEFLKLTVIINWK